MTIENGCLMSFELIVLTSVPSRFECCTWSSNASHQYRRSIAKSIASPFGQPNVTLRKTIKFEPSVYVLLMLAGLSHSEKNINLLKTTITVNHKNGLVSTRNRKLRFMEIDIYPLFGCTTIARGRFRFFNKTRRFVMFLVLNTFNVPLRLSM